MKTQGVGGVVGLGEGFLCPFFFENFHFSTDNGGFRAGGAIWPPPIGNRVKG